MKFEQAFYTWGLEQLSFAKEGLGICASSNLDEPFLKKCMTIGSKLNSEGTERTAEFVLYSSEFDTFIGIGISPRASKGDKRINKLCHFYIPVERENRQEPADYLLKYPFQKVVAGQQLCQQEIERKEYDYSEILARYNYDSSEENNKRRLAKLLWKAFRCAFGEDDNVFFVIDRGLHQDIEEDAKMAREITWLLCMLMPRPEGCEDFYYKQLSYGVYTNENTDIVRFIFTDRLNQGANQLLIDMPVKDEEEVPAVYEKMAECAQESLESFQNFLSELLACSPANRLENPALQKLYVCWKISHGIPVTKQEMHEEFCKVRMIVKSPADRKVWLNYLKLTDELTMNEMIDYWGDAVRPLLEKYEELDEEEKDAIKNVTEKFLRQMFEIHRKNYRVMVRKIPKELQKEIVCKMHAKDNSYLQKEYDEIDSVDDLRTFYNTYGFFDGEEAYVKNVMDAAKQLYEDLDREARCEISEMMRPFTKGAWEIFTDERYQNYTDFKAFLEFVQAETEKIEPSKVACCYKKMLDMAEKEEMLDLEVMMSCEKALSEIEDANIPFESKLRFTKLVGEEIERKKYLSDALYENLLEKVTEMRQSEEKPVKKFFDSLWECACKSPEKIKRCIQFQIAQGPLAKQHSVWSELGSKDFAKLYDILKAHPGWEEKICCVQTAKGDYSFTYKSYYFWKKVSAGYKVEAKDMPNFSYNSSRKRFLNLRDEMQLKELLQSLKKGILEKQDCDYQSEDVYNYFFLHLEEQKLSGIPERKSRERERYHEIRDSYQTFARAVKGLDMCCENREILHEWACLKEFLLLSDGEEKEVLDKKRERECRALEEEIQKYEQKIKEYQKKIEECRSLIDKKRKRTIKADLPSCVTERLPEAYQTQKKEAFQSATETSNKMNW